MTAAARSRSTERLSRGSRAGDGCGPCEGPQLTATPLQSQLDSSYIPCRKPPVADRQEGFCPFRGFESAGQFWLLAPSRPGSFLHMIEIPFTSLHCNFLDGRWCKHDARLLPSEVGKGSKALLCVRGSQDYRMAFFYLMD